MRRRRGHRYLGLETLEVRLPLAADTYLVNFQPAGAAIPNRYLVDSGQTFGNRGNGLVYGWSTSHTNTVHERGIQPDQRLDTVIAFHQFQNWEFQLANGTYEVTASIGDPANASVHRLIVEGVDFWTGESLAANQFRARTQQVTVSDGRLTLSPGNSAEMATRINYLHIQGVASPPNAAPATPTVTEPAIDAGHLNPSDVHMEAIGFSDPDGHSHRSTDWEIWTAGGGAERVWFTLGIEGVERLHTHLGDGFFENSHAGRMDMLPNTDYELRVRFRDSTGMTSADATRLFATGAASTVFPLRMEDVADVPPPTWIQLSGVPVELPASGEILSQSDPIIAIDTDGNSSYPGNESPQLAIDRTLAKYLNFGELNSGFIVTPGSGPSVIHSFQMTTANDAEERDPTSWQLYGTNEPIASTDNSTGTLETWTLIDSGSVSLPSARNTPGPGVPVDGNTGYASYRMVITGVKNAGEANSMQFAEIQFFGEQADGPLLSPGRPIIAIDTDGNSSYPGVESPPNAIDRTLNKYLNFGELNSGFIVTPAGGLSVVQSFQITTANDASERDPASWQLYGTNDPIVSTDNSNGSQENWTLIGSGGVALPTARNTLGPVVAVANSVAYQSYRMVFPTVRNAASANSMQLAEVQFFGELAQTPENPALRLESAAGELLLRVEGSDLAGNLVTNPDALMEHVDVRVVVSGGTLGLMLGLSDLTFTDDDGLEHTVYLPAIDLEAGEDLYLWVALDGSTYYGLASQTEPNFSQLARSSQATSNFVATQPGFVVEVVAEGLQLPVNVAFVPNPGSQPGDPKFYVTELYGAIKVVTNDGEISDYATGLLNFDPTGNFPGSGEQGLTGIVVDPATGDVFVTRVTDTDGMAGGEHHPQVLRFSSNDGGLTAATQTVIRDMVGESQGQSHQISNVTIGPDGKLYVHNGDGFDASTALNLNSYRGKILRMNLDGTAPSDNPLFDASNGINARDYVFAYGFRNPFGGAWRASDGRHYEVENGPSVDRMARVDRGANYGWNGSDASMQTNAIYNWNPAHAPVNIAFIQPETLGGSQFPVEKYGHAFVSESGPTYAQGPQSQGKRIVEFQLDADGNVIEGPTSLVEYVGPGRATVAGLTAGPDGLYFTDLYKDVNAQSPIEAGARVLRIRSIAPFQDGDFNHDGNFDCLDVDDLVANIAGQSGDLDYDLDHNGLLNTADLGVWLSIAGANNLPSGNPFLPGDANLDGLVDGSDFSIWNSNKFTIDTGWCGGDFNADGVTDGGDFGIWNSNKFTSALRSAPALGLSVASVPHTSLAVARRAGGDAWTLRDSQVDAVLSRYGTVVRQGMGQTDMARGPRSVSEKPGWESVRPGTSRGLRLRRMGDPDWQATPGELDAIAIRQGHREGSSEWASASR